MREQAADPKLIRLVRELDQERTRRIKVGRKAATLLTALARMRAQKTKDAKPKPEPRPAG